MSGRIISNGQRHVWCAPIETPAPTVDAEQALVDRAAFGESFLVITPDAPPPLPVDDHELVRSIVRHIDEASTFNPTLCWTGPSFDLATIEREAAARYADYRLRHVTGWLPAETWDAAVVYSPDAAGVRFSQITEEAEQEMAEWDAILKGQT